MIVALSQPLRKSGEAFFGRIIQSRNIALLILEKAGCIFYQQQSARNKKKEQAKACSFEFVI